MSSLSVEEFWWYYPCDETGYCSEDVMYEGVLFFDFSDGSYLIQRVQVFPNYDVDNMLHIDIVVVGMQISVPTGAVQLDYDDTAAVLTQFALDYANPLISEVDFCSLYFAGAPECIEGRQEFLDANGTAVYQDMLELLHDDGTLYYEAEFLMTISMIDDTQYAKVKVYLLVDGNHFIEFMHMDGPDYPDDPAHALYLEIEVMLNNLTAEFTNTATLSVDFCNEYFAGDLDCIALRDDIVNGGMLSSLWVEDFYWFYQCDDDDVCDDYPSFNGYLLFDFNDGSYIRQRFQVNPWHDDDGILHIELTITENEISVPIGSLLQDAVQTEIIITQFALDYSSLDMSDEDFCALYFAGVPNCMKDREKDLIDGMSFVYDTMTPMIDDFGLVYYAVEFIVTMGDMTEVHTGPLRVWQVAPGEFFIEFIDQNPHGEPENPGDMIIASYEQALLMYNNFLADYELILVHSDDYICEVYFHVIDTTENCIEGRNQFVGAGGFNTFISMIEIDVVDGDNFFEVTIEQYNPLLTSTETITYGFYAYVDPDGSVWMITITQAG